MVLLLRTIPHRLYSMAVPLSAFSAVPRGARLRPATPATVRPLSGIALGSGISHFRLTHLRFAHMMAASRQPTSWVGTDDGRDRDRGMGRAMGNAGGP